MVSGADGCHWRRKWTTEGNFYGLPEEECEASTNDFTRRMKDTHRGAGTLDIGRRDKLASSTSDNHYVVISDICQSDPAVMPTPGTGDLLPQVPLVDTYGPTSNRLLDLDHTWHPDSYGSHFTNGTLTIAVNGLSLFGNWCDPQRVPH